MQDYPQNPLDKSLPQKIYDVRLLKVNGKDFRVQGAEIVTIEGLPEDHPVKKAWVEVPEIEVHIIESEDKMGGIGEPGVPPAAPAVINAIYDAVGGEVGEDTSYP
ncbi:MAG: hypothetical protein DRG31_05600 [Deltaproteobacteria bacterium]|nr:MAG: hypothetical protein DRG31_05600 [Deltaproteobacteria bacterium]